MLELPVSLSMLVIIQAIIRYPIRESSIPFSPPDVALLLLLLSACCTYYLDPIFSEWAVLC